MTYGEISLTMRSFVGGWEAFRKLGFRSRDIYLMVSKSYQLKGAFAAFVALRTQGREFHAYPADGQADALRQARGRRP